MDDGVAVNNENKNNMEKKIKQKNKKDKRSKKIYEDIEETHNGNSIKAAESALMSEKECISEVNWDNERDKQKKKKIKGAKDAEASRKNGSREGGLTMVFGENGGGLGMDIAERNGENCSGSTVDIAERNGEGCSGSTVDNAERKKKKTGKKRNKDDKFDMLDIEGAKWDKSIGGLDRGSISGKESGKEVLKAKKRILKNNETTEGVKDGEAIKGHNENCLVDVTETRKKRKNNKRKQEGVNLGSVQHENLPDVQDHTRLTYEDGIAKTKSERKKKQKHKKEENYKDDMTSAQREYADNGTNSLLNTYEMQNSGAEYTNKRKKKKNKNLRNSSDDGRDIIAEYAIKRKKRELSLVENGLDGNSPNKSNKKVRFSDQDEVFPLPSSSNLVRGRRFTREEDELVEKTVLGYIEEHDLGDEGLNMILSSKKHPELRGCWKKIGSAIPHRPYTAVYYRARILIMRSKSRKWTQEEYGMIKKYQKVHGNRWKALADELGKHPWHVKDTWRRIKFIDLKKGPWSQVEYQKLFDLVNTDLQLKISEEERSKHGILKDNICWTSISDSLSTRTHATCSTKWYNQMSSPMVREGVWADSDDYRLLRELYSLDATCLEDVDWDDLIDTRSGDLCRKRWSQMILHKGHHRNKPFAEQVEVLAQRYCPHLLEARETWDNKPRAP